jgi:WD40 repeat protein
MSSGRFVGLLALVITVSGIATADSVLAQKADATKVFPRVEPKAAIGPITALTFSPDGKRLFAAGFDKVVRVWDVDADKGTFVPSGRAYRVPIGPGTSGTINALAP